MCHRCASVRLPQHTRHPISHGRVAAASGSYKTPASRATRRKLAAAVTAQPHTCPPLQVTTENELGTDNCISD